MNRPWYSQLTRRQVLRGFGGAGLGLAAAACAAPGTSGSSAGGKAQLRILQWTHFVPAYDTWFDKFAKDWGDRNGVPVTVDHLSPYDLPARLAAEVAARTGHDLVEENGQIFTYRYTNELLPMDDIVDYVAKKYGQVEPLGEQVAKVNGTWVGVPNFYIAILPIVRSDLMSSLGVDYKTLKTWDQYLQVGEKLKAVNHAAGLAVSHCNDANHNWRALMWAFGASEVAEDGRTVTVDSAAMREFLQFAQSFYKGANTPEVFAWQDVSDNQWLDSGQGGFIHDAISSMRSVQSTNPQLYATLALNPPVAGPAAPDGVSMPDSNVYTIWKFTPKQNQDAAKEFLRYYFDHYAESFTESQSYNMPFYANRYDQDLFPDPKLAVLQSYRGKFIHTFGYPGPPTAAATVVLNNYVIPDMVGIAVRGNGSGAIDDAIKFAKDQLATVYK